MNKGEIYELTIEDMSAEGQGIGRIREAGDAAGMVVFVGGTVIGDRVRARLTKVKKHFAFGRLEEILEPSAQRSEEFDCPYFTEGCGGCPWAKLSYQAQLETKERQVRNKLQRIAGIEDPMVRPIIGMEDADNDGQGPFRDRDKAQMPVSTGGITTLKGGIVQNLGDPAIGFFQARSHQVVDCGDCYLQSMAAVAAADALRRFMAEDNITGFDPKWEKGLLRHLIVRTAFATGEVMVILVINGKGIPNAAKLIEMLDDAVYQVGYSLESVVLNINRASGKNVEKNKKKDRRDIAVTGPLLGDEYITIAGRPVIKDLLGDLEIEISPASFYQVNPVQMKRLYDKVREYCGASPAGADAPGTGAQGAGGSTAKAGLPPAKKPVILDLYCGIGSIGLYCADLAEMVIGIESVKEAVTDANRNAVINGIVGARYICGRAEEVLPAYMRDGEDSRVKIDPQLQEYIRRADIAILDPPRAGCRPELLEAVCETGVERIIYVSCDPATLARDVLLLRERGYRFVEAAPVDMFPHTGHVESCVLLERVSNRKADSYVKLNVKMADYYRIKDSAETENAEE